MLDYISYYIQRQMKVGQVEESLRYLFGFKCGVCGTHWSPNFMSGGRLRRGFWKCPFGCTDKILAEMAFEKEEANS